MVSGLPELKMYVVRGSFPSGLHIFRFRHVQNPLAPALALGYFRIGTFSDLRLEPKGQGRLFI